MNHCRPYLKQWLCALLLAGVMALPVTAQESIVFSKPAGQMPEKADSFMNDQHRNLGSFNAPAPVFGSSKPRTDFDVLPGAQPIKPLSPGEVLQMQKYLDDKKNWILLTPEEILGVPTPQKIMGLPDPDNDANLSATERYMNRQTRLQNSAATNAIRVDDYQWGQGDNPFNPQDSRRQKFGQDPRYPSSTQNHSGLLKPGSSGLPGADPDQNPDSIWHNAFPSPPALPKPDLEQMAAMDRFRAMMDPTPAEKPETVPGYAPAPVTPVPDPNMQHMPASYNPNGATFAPLQNNAASRPMGIAPLPTITGQLPNQTPAKAKPLVEPPPWLSGKPQPGVPLKRKF